MTPHHHPSDETILSYAAGSLASGPSLVVACHLSFCAECRMTVGRGEAIGGHLLDELAPAALSGGARERALALLEGVAPDAPVDSPPSADTSSLPAPLARQLGHDL